VRIPGTKKLGTFGAHEPSSSGLIKELKEGACQMGIETRDCGGEKGGYGEVKVIFVLAMF